MAVLGVTYTFSLVPFTTAHYVSVAICFYKPEVLRLPSTVGNKSDIHEYLIETHLQNTELCL